MSGVEDLGHLARRPGMRLVAVRDDVTTSRVTGVWALEGDPDPVQEADSPEVQAYVETITAHLMHAYTSRAHGQPATDEGADQ